MYIGQHIISYAIQKYAKFIRYAAKCLHQVYGTFYHRSTTNSASDFSQDVDLPSNPESQETHVEHSHLYEEDNVPYLVGEVEAQKAEPSLPG